MNSADVIVLLIIAAIVAGVIKIMKIQKKKGSSCCSGCSGCSKAKTCSSAKLIVKIKGLHRISVQTFLMLSGCHLPFSLFNLKKSSLSFSSNSSWINLTSSLKWGILIYSRAFVLF